MSKRTSLAIAFLLLAALLLGFCAPAFAEGGIRISVYGGTAQAEETLETAPAEDDSTIHIRTAEDLLDLARACSLDTWSDGKRVVLENDLSLTGAGFASIPVFNGEFDGGGHTIYDLELSSASSPCGFFIETGTAADIHDLNLSGRVITQGNDSVVGGVAGRNRGMLTGCSFSGEVSAISALGGIAGENTATGSVIACLASGSVSGLGQVGGIVGENAGAVYGSENRCFVNTESVDPALRLEGIDTSSILNFIHSLRADNAGITTDIGGIAGSNTGFIERSTNSGTVGYLHLGYNVGGIAGRSSGYINGCANNGEVYGRSNVGGVIGQAQPLTEIVQAQNLLAGLSYRLKALNRALNDAAADVRTASAELSDRFQAIEWSLDPVGEAIQAMDINNPDTFFYAQSAISDGIYNVRNSVSAFREGIGDQSRVLLSDLDYINENLNALSGAAVQTVDSFTAGEDQEDVVVDDSDQKESEEEITYGKTVSCDNNGSVYGDSNVGGIAGALSVETDTDPLLDLTGSASANRLSRSSLNVSAVVTGCVNRGAVTAKHECAGGIAGKMDLGVVSHCAAYGTVAIEDGDYAGGICGLLYGSVKASCVKCSLSAKRYAGGIVGNGYNARRGDERSSNVSGCYTLVELRDDPQFAGAVSGGGDGVYEDNFFVESDYAGLGRLSIHGQAEPISFEDFAAVPNLPAECRTFTLRFVVDGAVIKELPFEYGASFDRAVFPAVERRDGAYAVWDRSELNDLRFDTTVTAEYRMDEAVLRSELTREDGRAAVYVDGQFQHGDTLRLELIPVEEGEVRAFTGTWKDTVREQLRSIFREGDPDYSIPVSVAERLRVRFPADGLDTHSLRYLTPDGQTENYRLYLAGADGWQRIRPDTFGSYYLIEVPGSEAELTLVSTIQSWWIVAYIAAALALFALVIFMIVKLRKFLRSRPKKEKKPRAERPLPKWLRAHRKPILIALPVLLLATAAFALQLRFGSFGSVLSAYRIIKDFSMQETDVKTEISIRTEERNVDMSTTVHRVLRDGHMIRCVEEYGIPLYISEGMVCLENGRVFRLAEGVLSQGRVLDLALDVFLHEQIEKTREGDAVCYSARIAGERAERILRLFTSASEEELLRADSMTVSLLAEEGTLKSARFTGLGETAAGKSFDFTVVLTPEAMTERPVIPQAVADAIGNGGGEDTQILSEDLLLLLAAWVKNESAGTVSAEIDVDASCGAVELSPHYRYTRRAAEGTDVSCITSALFSLYFTDSAACTAQGLDLSEAQQRVADTARLIPIARELCLKGAFSRAGTGERAIYTVALSEDDAADIVSRVLPELTRLGISYEGCRLRITVNGGELESIELDCGGTLRIVSRDIEATILVTVRFNDDPVDEIPDAVRAVLVK